VRKVIRLDDRGRALLPGMDHVPWGNIAAASTIVPLPLVILVLICQH
jgi:hypothetical protein